MSETSRSTADAPSLPLESSSPPLPAAASAPTAAAAEAAPTAQAGENINLGNEHLLGALLQRQRQERIALAISRLPGAAILHPSAPINVSALPPPPLGLDTGGLPLPLDLYLAAARQEQQQQQLLSSISPSTLLDLAQHRPDLLALLQLPPTAPQALARTNPQTMEAASALPSLLATKRKRSNAHEETGEEEEDAETGRQDESKVPPAESAPTTSRPRKRVMFLGDTGTPSDDNVEFTYEEGDAWTATVHRSFVQAVYETGMRHASPSVLLDHMVNAEDFPLTSERVKSRLQKYRNNSEKSLAEFMQEYDAFVQRALSIGRQSTGSTASLLPLAKVLLILGQEKPLCGGDAAAAVTYNMLYKQSLGKSTLASPSEEGAFDSVVGRMLTPASLRNNSSEFAAQCQGQKLLVPRLTEDEKANALGASFEHFKEVFGSLVAELERQRGQVVPKKAHDKEEPESETDEDDKKPKALETHVGSKAIHSKTQGEGSEEDEVSNTSAEKKKDEISSIVAQMYQHKFNRSPQNHQHF